MYVAAKYQSKCFEAVECSSVDLFDKLVRPGAFRGRIAVLEAGCGPLAKERSGCPEDMQLLIRAPSHLLCGERSSYFVR